MSRPQNRRSAKKGEGNDSCQKQGDLILSLNAKALLKTMRLGDHETRRIKQGSLGTKPMLEDDAESGSEPMTASLHVEGVGEEWH